MITFKRVNKWFGATHVLRDVDLVVRVGEVVVACNGQWHGDQFEKSNLVPHDKVVYRNYGYEIVEVNGETLLVIPLSNIVAKFVEKE